MTAQIHTRMINHDFTPQRPFKIAIFEIAHIGGRYYSDAFHSRLWPHHSAQNLKP